MPPTSPAVAAHPLWGKAVSAVVGGAGAAAVLYAFHSFGQTKETMLIIAGGLLAVALLLVLYRLLLGWWQKRKAAPMTRSILANSSAAPHGISDPAKRAKLDEMRKSFETGVNKFRAAGKDLYTLPWFVLVGEPGGGKTEAIRHSQVGFPHGLQDYMQGAGGTVNMNWWFTNHAIILDTAGRLMFEEVAPGTTNEWGEFLSLLRQNRPNCPINGMVLVIPADTLIKDSTEAIERKAGKIAQQLDLIQRTLEVRFPVFVVISKCDLVSGFREFFETVDDPQLQGQIMGWSNPMSLDQPFNPEMVDEHLKTVRQRLANRRYGLLLDPVHTEDPNARRIDQVDALYTFPDALARIGPRLRRYLEMIFVAGEWSPKPLFLRGIYFTSSMREGAALDAELAEVLKVPVDSLQDEGRAWERNKTFFLREPFLKKIFVEKGLVTRASRPNRLHRARKLGVLGFGFLAVLVLSGLTYQGARKFKQSLGTESEFWPTVRENYPNWAIVDSSGRYNDLKLSGVNMTLNELFEKAPERHRQQIKVPAVFQAAQVAERDFTPEVRKDAYRAVYEKSVLEPLLREVRGKLSRTEPSAWTPDATAALRELVKLEAAAKSSGAGTGASIQLDPLFKVALREDAQAAEYNRYLKTKQTNGDFTVAADWLYSDADATWPPPRLGLGTPQSLAALERGVRTFRRHWDAEMAKPDPLMERAGKLKTALDDYNRSRAAADAELIAFKGPLYARADFDKFKGALDRHVAALAEIRKAVETAEGAVAAAMPNGTLSVDALEGALGESARRRNGEVELQFEKLREVAGEIPVRGWLGPAPKHEVDDQDRRVLLALRGDLGSIDVEGLPKVRRYAAAEQVYRQAAQELSGAAGASATTVDQLGQVLETVGNAVTDRSGLADDVQQRAAGQELKLDAAFKTWKLAVQSAGAFRRNAAIASVLKDVGDNKLDAQVAKAAQSPMHHPGTVPFTELHTDSQFEAKYDPDAARRVLGSIRELQAQFPPASDRSARADARSRVLDFEALLKTYTTLQAGTGEYLKDYVQYWTTAAPALASFRPDQMKRFDDFFLDGSAKRNWNANTINTQLGLHAQCVRDALKLVNEFPADPDTRDAARDKDREMAAALRILQGRFGEQCNAVLQNWLGSARDAAAARRAILELEPAQLPRFVYRVDGGAFVTEYWYRLSLHLLELLVADFSSKGTRAFGEFARDFDGFPLTLTTERRELTVDEVAKARATLVDKVLGGHWTGDAAPAERGSTIGARAYPPNFERNDLLERLVSPYAKTPQFARLRKVLDALVPPGAGDEPATCTVLVLDAKRRDELVAKYPGRQADLHWRDIGLQVGNAPVQKKTYDPRNNGGEKLGSFSCRGTKLSLVLGQVEAKQDTPPVPFPAPWGALHLIYSPGVVKRALPRPTVKKEGGGVEQHWDVEVEVADKGQKCSVWLEVVYDRELPDIATWSTQLKPPPAN